MSLDVYDVYLCACVSIVNNKGGIGLNWQLAIDNLAVKRDRDIGYTARVS